MVAEAVAGVAIVAFVAGLLIGYALGHAIGRLWSRLVRGHGTAEAYRLLGELEPWPPAPPLRKGSGDRPTSPRPRFPGRPDHQIAVAARSIRPGDVVVIRDPREPGREDDE